MKEKTSQKNLWGVILINMGSPSSPEDISDFLYQIFRDRHILPLPRTLRTILAKIIARMRTGKTALRYQAIGGLSPLPEETEKQRAALENAVSIPVEIGMRYSRPFIPHGISRLKDRGVDHLVLLPLYPQFSTTTTLSALDYFEKSSLWNGPVHIIPHHYDHPLFISAHRELLHRFINSPISLDKTAVVFIAHAIPVSRVKQDDPYVKQVESTVSSISRTLSPRLMVRTAYQSRLGPVPWQGPSLIEVLEEISTAGKEHIIAHPLSFSTENLETLYDLDIEFKQKCRVRGLVFSRVPAPGLFPQYIQALSAAVRDGIHQWETQHA